MTRLKADKQAFVFQRGERDEMVKVKPLEWVEVDGPEGKWWKARNPLGGLQFEAWSEEGKEATDTRYTQKVLSCLEPQSPVQSDKGGVDE